MSGSSTSAITAATARHGGVWAAAWAGAWRRTSGKVAIAWLAIIALLAVLAPVISSSHPVIQRDLGPGGLVTAVRSPLLANLSRIDAFLLAAIVLVPLAWLGAGRLGGRPAAWLASAFLVTLLLAVLHPAPPVLQTFDQYARGEADGSQRNTYTLNSWSPTDREPQRRLLPPGSTVERGGAAARIARLGTDALGQDVLSQLLHACRLSISIGLVSTGVAVLIGVSVGALMGYFGGWVDALLLRVVEVFMSVPTLLLLVTAAAVLPRNTYVLMAVIGCCSWTGAARFTRAEFLRLRELDWVTAARASGVGTPSLILRHILPAAITPVLVEAGFAIASAVLAESTLSYLGLGPAEQPSWGRLLSDAVSGTGEFHWWLGVLPGAAIFATVLAYNVLSESMRAGMNPKDAL